MSVKIIVYVQKISFLSNNSVIFINAQEIFTEK